MIAAVIFPLSFAAVAPAQPSPRLLGETSRVRLGLLEVGAKESRWTQAAATLAAQIRERTSVEPADDVVRVRIADPHLFRTPLLVLSGSGAFAPPSAADQARLRRHLAYGGLLLVDDSEARPGGGFDASARDLVRALFPAIEPAAVRPDHVLYKSFYLLDGAAGRVGAAPALDSVEQDGRIVVLLSPNDLGGGVAAGDERSIRLAINVVLYALCLDYKEDQVHVPFILRRRRFGPEP